MTVAGSDSGAGAGIQTDIKTFGALGVFGTTAVTALTAQNTAEVRSVHLPPPEFVETQMDAVLSDIVVSAVKTGMLGSAAVIDVVARRAAAGDLPNLVVDPVMVASSGARLLDLEAEAAYPELLFPYARVVTPNLREAGVLVAGSLACVDDMREAAEAIHDMGPSVVVVKGGHLDGDAAVDVVFDGRHHHLLDAPRVRTSNVHGSGCTLSAAIAAYLAHGADVLEALHGAKDYVTRAIEGAARWSLGKGNGPLDHLGFEQPGGAPEEGIRLA
jgi:hydroxymethylpyrimidine/phosphomethylpyrimidine kinase